MSDKHYAITEIFNSPQGEGMRAGTLNHFLRFSGCNQTCRVETHNFDCDTDFSSFRKWTIPEILTEFQTVAPKCKNVIFTGGEPLLQLDKQLVDALKAEGYYLAIETNGSLALPEGVPFGPEGIDWITVSPKVAEHAIRMLTASEVKYVRGYNQGIPRPTCQAEYKLLSPAFNGLDFDRRAMQTCVDLLRENPDWRMSVQMHKAWLVR
jgi:7-carboxy-7-deazaguanine synthase